MPTWNLDYFRSLGNRFESAIEGLDARLQDVVDGRVQPSVDTVPIGGAKSFRGAVLFFDIRGFSARTGSAEPNDMKKALYMLDSLIPMLMQIVYDHNGYIEKNTGDGVMAVIGVEDTDSIAAGNALSAGTTMFYVLRKLVNPHLRNAGIAPISARIGIDLGALLLARIGTPKGSARDERSFLTAVGPSANLASKLQNMAGTDQIWVGDNIKRNGGEFRQPFFHDVTPIGWTWHYKDAPSVTYKIWHYDAVKLNPT